MLMLMLCREFNVIQQTVLVYDAQRYCTRYPVVDAKVASRSTENGPYCRKLMMSCR